MLRIPSPAAVAVALSVLGLLLAPYPAAAVTVTAGTGSGIAGQLVDVDIATTNLTGRGVLSYQFGLTFNGSLLSVNNVFVSGTLTGNAGWGAATYNAGSGTLSVSAAGTTPLSGSGALLRVEFLINPAALGSNYSGLAFTGLTFNEGAPLDTTVDGSVTINATPIITVSPNTGTVVRTQTLQFSVSGSVVAPVTWGTTDASIATISSAGLLTGVAPGTVRVFAVDAGAHRDTSDGAILVVGMGLSLASPSVVVGQTATVPVNTTSVTGLGVRAGQITLAFDPTLLTPLAPTTPAGTLLNGYAAPNQGVGGRGPGTLTVDFAGGSDLAGAGTLFDLNFRTLAPGYSGLSFLTALFNETLPAQTTDGYASISALPTLSLSPGTVTLLAGQTQPFSLSGPAVPPVTWSTLDPSVATINAATGVLTAVAGGVTRVKVVDNVGATGLNTSVTIYDFKATVGSLYVGPGGTVRVPITLDRDVSALGIRSAQYTLIYGTPWITGAVATRSGLLGQWGPPTQNPQSDRIVVATAGTQPLATSSTLLHAVDLTISPGATNGTSIPLTLAALTFNEGHPTALVLDGSISVSTASGVDERATSFALEGAEPNPVGRTARIAFSLPAADTPARLVIYGLDGSRVRVLADARLPAGRHEIVWDVRDDGGRVVAPGVYLCRLECGGMSRVRRMAVVR